MAKNKIIKRVLLKNGGVRYYSNGKRLKDKSGSRKFIKQKYAPEKELKQEEIDALKTQLSNKEFDALKRIQQAKRSYKYKGFPKVPYAYVQILRELQAIPEEDPINKDLYNLRKPNGDRLFPQYDDIKKYIDEKAKKKKLIFEWCNEVGLPSYRGRDFETFANNRLESIVDIVTLLDSPSFRKYKFMVFDTQGDEILGRTLALLSLKDFEIKVGTDIQAFLNNSAYLRFCYRYEVMLETKTIFIDLTDINPTRDLTDYFFGENTTAKQSVMIKGKYKDCIIQVDFS